MVNPLNWSTNAMQLGFNIVFKHFALWGNNHKTIFMYSLLYAWFDLLSKWCSTNVLGLFLIKMKLLLFLFFLFLWLGGMCTWGSVAEVDEAQFYEQPGAVPPHVEISTFPWTLVSIPCCYSLKIQNAYFSFCLAF